jgi:uncharacterized protein (TIGR00369 family)
MSIDFFMDDSCFACGQKNENGLKLEIIEKEGGVWAMINPPAWSQGYSRIVHGGVIATILDEMAVWAAFKKGYRTVTAELNMRIRRSMHVDQAYTARARIHKSKHRLVEAESEIMDSQDSQVATARVKLLRVEQ